MSKYKVTAKVERIKEETVIVEVSANNEKEAKEKGLELAKKQVIAEHKRALFGKGKVVKAERL